MKLLSVLILCFVFMRGYGEIVHAPHLKVFEKAIDNLDENSLVVLDVDYTILIPEDQLLRPCGETYLYGLLMKMGDKFEVLSSIVSKEAKFSLVDPHLLKIIDKIKEKNVKIIALTNIISGGFGCIPNVEAWRVSQLSSLGIDLSFSFPDVNTLVLEGFSGKKTPPVFHQGVIVTGRYSKGDVLVKFLKQVNLQPSSILFLDDRIVYVQAVEKALEKENIPHTSFHYTAAWDEKLELDIKLAEFQCEYLIKNGKWISDEEARLLNP